MRKRPSRPARFAAVDNEAIDTLPSILSVGLLTRLIRAKDGDDVTVDKLTEQYAEGRKSLERAMRELVEAAYVVKFKIQSRVTDTDRRGGAWWTTFSVDSVPFTREDVDAMLAGIVAEGNVRAIRVEPAHLDPRKDPQTLPDLRPTPPNRPVGPTCGKAGGEDLSPGRTDTPFSDGRSTDGRSGDGSIRKKTAVKNSHSGHAHPAGDGSDEREGGAQRQDEAAGAVADVWVNARQTHGHGVPLRGPDRIRKDAERLLATASGLTVNDLVAAAADMGKRADWFDLGRHLERFVPASPHARTVPDGPRCPHHPGRALDECPCQRADPDAPETGAEAHANVPPPREALAEIMSAIGAEQGTPTRGRAHRPTRAQRDAQARAEEERNRQRAEQLLNTAPAGHSTPQKPVRAAPCPGAARQHPTDQS